MTSRFTSGLAALSLAGLVVVAAPLTATAQEGEGTNPGQGSERCQAAGAPGNNGYPPGQQGRVSDNNAERGQRMSASSGCSEFAPGQRVRYGVQSVFQLLGTTVANAGGQAVATFTVPTNLSNGTHHVVFRGTGLTGAPKEVRIPFVVSGGPTAAAPGTGAGPAQGAPGEGAAGGGTVSVGGVNLPRTGSDEIIPLTLLGLGLVGAGAGIVVVARRRRHEAPGTTA